MLRVTIVAGRAKGNSEARRLLVISYHFPPDGAIGGQRWGGLSKYLSRLGWEVHVITAAQATPEQDSAEIHRHVVARRRTLNDVYREGKSRFARATSASGPAAAPVRDENVASALQRVLGGARRILGNSMSLPDHGRGWVLRAARAADGLLRERDFDVVISSGPPHSSHFAGLLATRGSNAEFWIDMRDPWAVTHEGHSPETRIIRAERLFLRQLERLVYRFAATVVVNTQEFARALRTAHPTLNVIHFPNGIDLEQMPFRDESLVGRGSMVYLGTLYAGRNLSPVFAAMHALLETQAELAHILRLRIAGPMEVSHRKEMMREIDRLGLADMVAVHGVLPRASALDLLIRSHLALVLAQDQPMQVPGKLYESVGVGVPTLVIAEQTGAAANEARRVGALTADGADVQTLCALLADLAAGRIPKKVEPTVPVSYRELATRMDGLLRGARTRRRA